MAIDLIYEEQVSSRKTEALFVTLALLFFILLVWRTTTSGLGFLSIAFLLLFSFFLFYSLNYRTLGIHMTSDSLRLRFGIFTRTVPFVDIERCFLDDTPMWRIGGAGIHFSPIRKRYRMMFNFIEYPRVVLALKSRRGPVRDIAFSTRRPQEVLRLITAALSHAIVPAEISIQHSL